MQTFYCRIIRLGEPFPRFATLRCRAPELAGLVSGELDGWSPFDVVEIRDERDEMVMSVSADTEGFRN